MMICKIVQNEGIVYILLLTCIGLINCAFVGGNSQTIQELCTSNKVSFSVKPGETQQFRLTSASLHGDRDKWYQKLKRKCYKEFHSNNGASHFLVVISNMTIPTCEDQYLCNYFEITESGYSQKFFGTNQEDLYFESKSDYLIINFHHKLSMPFQVTFTFTVKRNTFIITGSPKSDGQQSGQLLETPYFPNTYPLSYVAEYILQSNSDNSHVMLMFVDFMIAPSSLIEVVGHNNTKPAIIYGNTFRPPVFVSEGNRLALKFQANNGHNIGFRAICLFLKDSDLKDQVPYSDCGGLLTGYGGSISLRQSGNHRYYDCIWHILPSMVLVFESNFMISVSNITFGNTGSKVSLEFREGLHSKSKLVRNIEYEEMDSAVIQDETIVSASKGLYIRFNGYLNHQSFIHLSYNTYSLGNCSDSHLICNDKCLSSALRCDGTENCYDGSDEIDCLTTTDGTTAKPMFKRRVHNERAFFAFYVVLFFGIVGIIVVILVIVLVFYRMRKNSHEAIQEETDVNELTGPIPVPPPQVVSSYMDQPPSYEDFILASDCYPPPLYTRASKRFSEPFTRTTTSFCSRAPKRHHLVHSIDLHSLDSDENATEEVSSSEPGCSSFGTAGNNTELIIHPAECCLKRSTSFNSGVDHQANCHFHLSITHSIYAHRLDDRYQSLPTDLKVCDRNPEGIGITLITSLPPPPDGSSSNHHQGFSSCVCFPDTLRVESEVSTSVKTRCHSDPCRKVSFCYSLRCKKVGNVNDLA